jgi:hypothetical protein
VSIYFYAYDTSKLFLNWVCFHKTSYDHFGEGLFLVNIQLLVLGHCANLHFVDPQIIVFNEWKGA